VEHNEISAMYRESLKVVGISPENLTITPATAPERTFWDERIYNFANFNAGKSRTQVRIPLLLSIIEAVFLLQEMTR